MRSHAPDISVGHVGPTYGVAHGADRATFGVLWRDYGAIRADDLLREVIAELVHGGVQRVDTAAIAHCLRQRVADDALEEVVALVVNELHQLHEGNIARYRLRPSEFERWQAQQQT